MAVMYPRELLATEVKSAAEAKVFAALKDGLSDDWEVFHAASWVVRDPADGAKDGEIDFVLVHANRAIVCLEVKGGGIECQHGAWYGLHDGTRERIKDPFTQALDHRYALERKIDKVKGWRGKDLFIVHAVAFPDISVHSLALAPDAPRELILDRNDVRGDISAALDRVLGHHQGAREKRKPPDVQGTAMIREMLAPEVSIRVPMGERFLEEEEALIKLTSEQSLALARLSRNQRMVVYGCAGSGKTMLAVEHALRLARAGKQVLFVCFNKALAEHLAARYRINGVDFVHFHRLCSRLAKEAKVELPAYDDARAEEYFGVDLPEALVEAFNRLGPSYDALIVDEAQDLRDDWFAALACGLRDEKKAPIWLFMDDNQRVYDATLTVPNDFFAFDLSVNCRNTQAIHREVMKLYQGSITPEVRGPEGRHIELVHTDDQAAAVESALERLCGQEEIPPQDVVVLSGHGWEHSNVARAVRGRFTLSKTAKKSGSTVQFSSIRAFKGLESPAVVLCELENVIDDARDQQLYVGMSRARNHCVIVAPPAAPG